MKTYSKSGAYKELARLAQKYQAIMAGAYIGDENDILGEMEKLAKKYDLDLDGVFE